MSLISDFDSASEFIAKKRVSDNATKLRLYALYKQSKFGTCNTPKPSILDMTNRYKWNAWNELHDMSSSVAMQQYIQIVERLYPNWRSEVLDENPSENPDSDSDSDVDRGGGGGFGGFGLSISKFERSEEPIDEKDKDICYWTSTGDLTSVTRLLNADPGLINYTDTNGRTPLHFAVDRGHTEIVLMLLHNSELHINAQDNDGCTPLHYASLCDRPEICRLLLQAGADAAIPDNDGETVAMSAEGKVRQVVRDVLNI